MTVGSHDVHLQYDPSLPHQLAAVDAVVDLFDGALEEAAPVTFGDARPDRLELVDDGFANPAPHDEAAFEASLLARLREVQTRNGLPPAERLDGRHFTVEMETGTGKTYAFVRTIFELHAQYGLAKFVIVVPSVAIREGVLASLRSTEEHFRRLYATPIDYDVYDSRRLSTVRQFATSSGLQVLVMNVQSFQKDAVGDASDVRANVINRPHDAMSGRPPIEFIQAMRPVVVIDEPQNFESEGARAAIERLNPLCTLRYSATPRRPYNLVYRLGPVAAFEAGLVKQIEVDGVEGDATFNDAYVRLLEVDAAGARARVEINVGIGERARRSRLWVRRGDDLSVKARGRAEYRDGFIVDDVVFEEGGEALELTSGAIVPLGAASGSEVADVHRLQIRETIRYHLARERQLAPRGIKVLSLLFVDAVADYRRYDADGTPRLGPLGELFERELSAQLAKPRYAALSLPPVEQLHDAYFSQDGRGRAKDSRGEGEGDRTTYEKIMRGKEQLLSLDEPLRFVFTHSALREGWDNPNVFQVCTLAHTRSSITRRQQIGRGLRLPVDQHGARVQDPDVALLTVVANESYRSFASGLQVDYEQEGGPAWPRSEHPTVRDARRRVTVEVHEDVLRDAEFRALWSRAAARTRYRVRIVTDRVVEAAVEAIDGMEGVTLPLVRSQRAQLTVTEDGIGVSRAVDGAAERMSVPLALPDLLGALQNATELTRVTLRRILTACARLDEFAVNPHAFVVQVTRILRGVLATELVGGVAYERLDGDAWAPERLAPAPAAEITRYDDRLYAVRNAGKTPYSHVEWDSGVERRFAEALDHDERVRRFVKLPAWCTIDTPVGGYNPDWAILWDDGEGSPVPVVCETKASLDETSRRVSENHKIACARRHFAAIETGYEVVDGFDELVARMALRAA